jgi:hypothetical protein
LQVEIELSDSEVDTIRRLVSDYDGDADEDGLMPILEAGNKTLYDKLEKAIKQEMADEILMAGISNGDVDYCDEMDEYYEKETGREDYVWDEKAFREWYGEEYGDEDISIEDADEDDLREFWMGQEKDKMATDAKYLHSRYDTEGQVNVDDEEYLCQVPEWAKEG